MLPVAPLPTAASPVETMPVDPPAFNCSGPEQIRLQKRVKRQVKLPGVLCLWLICCWHTFSSPLEGLCLASSDICMVA